METSSLNLLIAEMLGDVGKLHNEIEQLKQVIPALSAKFEEQVNMNLKPTLDEIYAGIGRLQEGSKTLLLQQQQAAISIVTAQSKAIREKVADAGNTEIIGLRNSAAELREDLLDKLRRQVSLAIGAAFESELITVLVSQAISKVKSAADCLDVGIGKYAAATLALDTATLELKSATGALKDARVNFTKKLFLIVGGLTAGLSIMLYALIQIGGMPISDKQLKQFQAYQLEQQNELKHLISETQKIEKK
jgi:hypothetical protein